MQTTSTQNRPALGLRCEAVKSSLAWQMNDDTTDSAELWQKMKTGAMASLRGAAMILLGALAGAVVLAGSHPVFFIVLAMTLLPAAPFLAMLGVCAWLLHGPEPREEHAQNLP